MKLFHSPDNAACGTKEDQVEYNALKDMYDGGAQGDDAKYLQNAHKLLALPGLSRISLAAVYIIGEPYGASTQRFKNLTDSVAHLIEIRDEALKSGLVNHWMDYLEDWIDEGDRAIQAEMQAQ
jgi:hypothetical protein